MPITEGNVRAAPRLGRVRALPYIAAVGLAAAAGFAALDTNPAIAQLKSSDKPVFSPVTGAPASFADLVARVKPSVVSIQVVSGGDIKPARSPRRTPSPGAKPFPDLPDDHPLNEFFRGIPRNDMTPRHQPRPRRRAQGSGFVISADGYVVTNNHVISGADKIVVSFDEKEKMPAELIGTDPRTDLALLKIKSDKTFPFVRFATEQSREGDWVVAVGNPFGLGGTVTAGIISALSRDIGSGPYDFIQIDAAVNRGNSGGPTFNLKGEVVGVNTAIYSPSGGNVGIAFAVPAKTALEVIDALKKSGTVERGWLGVKIQNITDDMAEGLGLANSSGALVNEVTDKSPAEAAGLRTGDAIVAVNGRTIEDSRDLARKIADYTPGTVVKVKVRRGDRDETVDVKLGSFPTTEPKVAMRGDENQGKPQSTALDELGLTLRSGDNGEGVVIEDIDDNSDAVDKGLRQGDVIVEVNSAKVSTPADVDVQVQKAQKRGRKAVLMVISRNNQRRFVALQFMEKRG